MKNGIIYCIINKTNGKRYIGQTFVGLKKRYAGAWWKNGHNPYLRNSVEKYGVDNFEWEILKQNIKSVEELNKLEIYYADRFRCYYPSGYNIRQCGGNRFLHEETKKKISKANSKAVLLKDIRGKIFEIPILSVFCKEKGLNKGAIANMLRGETDYSQGYVRVDSDLSKIQKAKIYRFISPIGDIVDATVAEIRSKYGFRYWTLEKLISGKVKVSKGWRLLRIE